MKRNTRIILIIIAVISITLCHYSTSTTLHYFHNIYRRLYYLPIILGAFWFGLRGGVLTAIITSIVYLPHVIFQWGATPFSNPEQFFEIILFNAVGVVTGILVERESRRRVELGDALGRLREQSKLLISTEKELRRADRLAALGELSAGLAHEIRNPLGSIKGTAEIFRDRFPEGDRHQDLARILIKEANRLDRVLQDFLKFARPDTGDPGEADVARVIEDVLNLTHQKIKEKEIKVIKDVGENIPKLAIAPEQLKGVLLNIILNALQAVENGGMIRIASGIKQHKDLSRAKAVSVGICDNGPGIPLEERDKVFNPFHTTKQDGSGLGLTICQRVVHAYNGAIDVKENEEGGACFVIELPVSGN